MVRVTVWMALVAVTLHGCYSQQPGVQVHSPDQYVSYWHGDFPLIISVPHGGTLKPGSIPNRHNGCMVNDECVYDHSCSPRTTQCKAAVFKDTATREIADIVREEVHTITGRYPHMVINELHRSKMDANRAVGLATFGNAKALNAFGNYTLFIHEARTLIDLYSRGRGLFVDIHGQSHSEAWTELGYRISRYSLNSGDFDPATSSIRGLVERACDSDDVCGRNLLFGATSLGAILESEDLYVVPSPDVQSPGSGNYYSGGYNTDTYGSKHGGNIDAIQIEIPRPVRFGDYESYARVLAQAIVEFMETHQYYAIDN